MKTKTTREQRAEAADFISHVSPNGDEPVLFSDGDFVRDLIHDADLAERAIAERDAFELMAEGSRRERDEAESERDEARAELRAAESRLSRAEDALRKIEGLDSVHGNPQLFRAAARQILADWRSGK